MRFNRIITMSFAVAIFSPSISRLTAKAFITPAQLTAASQKSASTLAFQSVTRHSSNKKESKLSVSFLGDVQKAFSSMTSPKNKSPYYTIAITGASGLLGTALIDELSKKKDGELNGKPMKIVKLIRSESVEGNAIDMGENMISSLPWNPNAVDIESIDSTALESIDTIVHLAGENVGTGLLPGPLGLLGVQAWSQEKKDLIMNSRVKPTKALAKAIANCSNPTSFVVASGVGIYGCNFDASAEDDSIKPVPDETYDTSSTNGFLADVSRAWESASEIPGNTNSNSRVVNLRIAPILSKLGGALGKLYPIFFLGGGGNVGSGNQYFSYISARDAARAIVHVIETPELKGPVNLVAPTPCTNAQFTSALGKVLFRPTILPLPEFIVKLAFGEMGEEMLLGGVKAAPTKLLQSGFKFQHETIETALDSATKENI